MRAKILKAAGVVVLILAPFLIRWIYHSYSSLPTSITIATGPEEGAWLPLSQSLEGFIKDEGVHVDLRTEVPGGALRNLELLEAGDVDFALYLRGADRIQGQPASDRPRSVAFVCNLYTDMTLFVVRRDLYDEGLREPLDLQEPDPEDGPRRVAVGLPTWGQYGVSQAILQHFFGPDPKTHPITTLDWKYDELEAGFEAKELDAAFLTAGPQARIFRSLFENDLCELGTIPEIDAIVMKNVSLEKTEIPRGLFRVNDQPFPDEPIETIAAQTTLLTREDVPSQMVERVTQIVLSEPFIQENQLFELSREGVDLARRQPEFPMHTGAMHVYEPQLKPLVDPELMEATENLRSFAVSLLIAGFLVIQWWRRRAERMKDDRLDHYIAALLEVDRAQPPLMTDGRYDIQELQQTLDRVTALRNEALQEFSAKDFDEERAADSFLSLCDTVGNGISAKLARQQLDDRVRELMAAVRTDRSLNAGTTATPDKADETK
jgi:TRAP-type uncharacterized transport system substrate-binding protein